MEYDYLKAVTDDVLEYIRDNVECSEFDYEHDRNGLHQRIYDEAWTVDSLTGNASGSYTFNTWKAEEYLCHNRELLEEACESFDTDLGYAVKQGAEFCDVTIRCYE